MYELEYTGSVYTGEKKNGRLEGNGTYEFVSGNKVKTSINMNINGEYSTLGNFWMVNSMAKE